MFDRLLLPRENRRAAHDSAYVCSSTLRHFAVVFVCIRHVGDRSGRMSGLRTDRMKMLVPQAFYFHLY